MFQKFHLVQFSDVLGGVSNKAFFSIFQYLRHENVVNMKIAPLSLSRHRVEDARYNYFIVNEAPPGQPSESVGTFHLVDMPGLGYAKVHPSYKKAYEVLGGLTGDARQAIGTIYIFEIFKC